MDGEDDAYLADGGQGEDGVIRMVPLVNPTNDEDDEAQEI